MAVQVVLWMVVIMGVLMIVGMAVPTLMVVVMMVVRHQSLIFARVVQRLPWVASE